MKCAFSIVAAVGLAALAGCAATAPDTITVQPGSIKPRPVAAPAQPTNGAIFQASAYRPMFEDRRARLVGDTLTITISERTTAGKEAESSASRSGRVAATAPNIFGLASSFTGRLNASGSASNEYEDEAVVSSSNSFSGTLTVTVIDVQPNGNLVVSGEKQVALDRGTEFVRFSGVVNPTTIRAGNVVSSTQIADARAEYRTNSQIDKAQMISMLTRFFLSVSPL
jgi:flagellar L-ring protein precursor FlgH